MKEEYATEMAASKTNHEPVPPEELRRAITAVAIGGVAYLGTWVPNIAAVPALPQTLEAASVAASVYSGLYIAPMLSEKFERVAVPTRNFINGMFGRLVRAEQATQHQTLRAGRAIVALVH